MRQTRPRTKPIPLGAFVAALAHRTFNIEPEPPGHVKPMSDVELHDADGAVVSVPNTNVYTIVETLTVRSAFRLDSVYLYLLDAAGIGAARWRLAVNGITQSPYGDQRTFSTAGAFKPLGVRVMVPAGATITLEVAQNGAAALDVFGHLTGAYVR